MEEAKGNFYKPIIVWLCSGCFLVFAMVIVGGITRLTGSGLSITEWNVLMGTIPPLNDTDWQVVFEKYKASPQFQKENFHFELTDFKKIFWWEFIHRFTGRLIGIVFIVPFIFFLIKKHIDSKLMMRLIFIFLLGGLQGFFGWYMVKSGLVDNPRVSHYRLAIHLITAFATFGFIFQTILKIIYPNKKKQDTTVNKIYRLSSFLFFLIIVQIIYGAFVAGLRAGHIYNTFPKMGNEWIASSVGMAFENEGIKSLFENPATVQFIHRCIAVGILILYGVLIFIVRKSKRRKDFSRLQTVALNLTGVILAYQFLLGVLTLIFNVPVVFGVLHQMGAFFIFASLLFLLHAFRYESRQTH